MIKAITGTKDILPADIPRWNHLENIIRNVFANFNYKEIRTPVFEETSLFKRSVGEETDIVSKEMYTFLDRSKTSITLKPEMTAAVVRAFIEHSLGAQQSLVKLFYISPMFRQERPQAGRFRQFHQFGAEALGSKSPLLDVEMIQMSYNILKSVGLKELSVKINSLGMPEAREKYKTILKEYLNDKKNSLSEESKKRLETNILRIFDSKEKEDLKVMKDAPVLIDYIDSESKADFETVKENLTNLNIPFEIDPALVRGLDYYTKLTFEIISGSVGSQSALCGGGRYDLLVESLEGKPTPATGFAAGIERILLACENENSFTQPDSPIDLYLVLLDRELALALFNFAAQLRNTGISVEMDYLHRSVKAQMREANKMNARFTLFFGGEEYKNGMINLKNMSDGNEEKISLNDFEKLTIKIKKQ